MGRARKPSVCVDAGHRVSHNDPPKDADVAARRTIMLQNQLRLACVLLVALVASGASLSSPALAQGKKLKIGVVYDYTGPLAGGGSDLHALGAKIMIDGYAIEAIYADAQSKPDVAINEAVRLVEQEKVDMLLGFYSSAQCVPVAARVEQLKKFMWITTCISSAVLENRNLKYVFRVQT